MGFFRLALAISVMCTHLGVVHAHTDAIFGCTFLDGELAIQAFFTISGFYMALVLHEKYVGKGSYFIFITQRLLRLWPAYLASLVLVVGVLSLLMALGDPGLERGRSLFFWRDHALQVRFLSLAGLALANLTILGLSEFYYFGFDAHTGALALWLPWTPAPALQADHFLLNPPAWSISLEIYFYFLAPKLVRLPVRWQLALIAAGCAFRYAVTGIFHWPYEPFVYRNFLCQLGFFLAGSLCYRFYVRHRGEIEKFVRSWRHALWVPGVLMLFYRRLPAAHELYWVFVPLIICLVPLLFALTRENRVDRLVGELSYPFYLTHFVTLMVVYYGHAHLWRIAIGPLCLVLTLAMAWLLYRYVESWSETFRARLYHRQRPRVHLAAEYFPAEAIAPHSPP